MNRYKIKTKKLNKFKEMYRELGFRVTRSGETYEDLYYIKTEYGKLGSCRVDAKTGIIDFETAISLKKQLYLIRPLRFMFMIEKAR